MNEEAIANVMRKTIREERKANGRVRFSPGTWIALVALFVTGLTTTAAVMSQIYVTRSDYYKAQTELVEKISAINTNVQVHVRGKHGDLATWPEGR